MLPSEQMAAAGDGGLEGLGVLLPLLSLPPDELGVLLPLLSLPPDELGVLLEPEEPDVLELVLLEVEPDPASVEVEPVGTSGEPAELGLLPAPSTAPMTSEATAAQSLLLTAPTAPPMRHPKNGMTAQPTPASATMLPAHEPNCCNSRPVHIGGKNGVQFLSF